MNRWTRLGRPIFAVGVAGLGLLHLVLGNFAPGLEPVPGWVPLRTALAYLAGLIFLIGALGVLLRMRPKQGALALAVTFTTFLLVLQWPLLLGGLHDPGPWTTTFETLALTGAAWTLVSMTIQGGAAGIAARAGRIAFGVSLPVFAIQHFMYAHFVGTLIPGWIPGHEIWPWITGAAFAAAGLAIVTNIQGRLAAMLLGAMFASWVVVLHIPRVAAAQHAGGEWASLFVAIMMCGGSWLVAGGLAERA